MVYGGEEALMRQYSIGDEIGRSRFGTVRRCHSNATGEALALKTTRRRPLRRRGPPLARLRPRRPPPRARGRRAGRAARVRARRLPPPRGRAPRRQARQPPLRRRHERAQARRLWLRGVVRGRAAHVGPRRHAILRGARGGRLEGVRGEGGRVERRGGALHDALGGRALLRRHRARDLRGRAPRQPALPAARLRRRLARGQGPDAPHALQGRLPQVLHRTSPKASVDRELWRGCGRGLKRSMDQHNLHALHPPVDRRSSPQTTTARSLRLCSVSPANRRWAEAAVVPELSSVIPQPLYASAKRSQTSKLDMMHQVKKLGFIPACCNLQ